MSEMLPHHKRVLAALAATTHPYGEYCAHFKTICDEAEMANRSEVRRITRHLARKGLAEYHRGLSNDDGEFRGSGYCITIAGLSALSAALELTNSSELSPSQALTKPAGSQPSQVTPAGTLWSKS